MSVGSGMGYVKVRVKVRDIHKSEFEAQADLLVDTGTVYTVLRHERLEKLGVEPRDKRRFKTADGRVIERDVGAVEVEIKGHSTYSIVVFGESSDAEVLGVATLEELGLQVDPMTGELKPLELLLLSLY
jgi:aspartyl protease family protein